MILVSHKAGGGWLGEANQWETMIVLGTEWFLQLSEQMAEYGLLSCRSKREISR